ncbi:MAG: HlyC/CorC family transporter [Ruminococcaceae bacterium]|nr:HlyC/CorC family transporter [Oscillospiraceae bacterium]
MLPYIGIILCLLGSAFFSGTEIAYTSLSKMKIKKESENPSSPIWRLISFIYNHYDNALSTVLIGNNLVNIGATMIMTFIAIEISKDGPLNEDQASAIVTVLMTVIILIVGEITPKMIARRANEGFAKMAAYPVITLMVIFFPLVWVSSMIVKGINYIFRKRDGQEVTVTEEELENILDTAEEEGVMEETETELLQSALEFTDQDASDILTPRIDVVGFELGESMENVLKTISETQFSRFPVYEGTIDHVVGILVAKHLLKELVDNPEVKIEDLILEPVFIHKGMHLHDIMSEFRRHRTHMAIVSDEYGGIMGIVTMEDVLEELVGEIWDENDDIVNEFQKMDDNRFECAGEMNLSEFLDEMELDDEELETDCATVGGWATEQIGAMPVIFDSFDYKNLTILVKEVDEHHRILRLLVLVHHFTKEDISEED